MVNDRRTVPRLMLGVLLLIGLGACAVLPQVETYTLSVDVLGDGVGSVVSVPAGIDVSSGDDTGTLEVDSGTEVTLTATAAAGSSFEGWGGACAGTDPCVVEVDADTSVTATFTLDRNNLSVSVVTGGSAAGSVTSDPPGIDTGAGDPSEHDFVVGTAVTLTATATTGAFAGWSGGGCDDVKVPECTIPMDSAKSTIATFNDVQTLTVRVASGGDDAVEFLGDSVAGATWPNAPTPRWFEGWVWAERANLHLGWAVYHNLVEAAFRFPGVDVPVGAIVNSAVLQVTATSQEDAKPATGDMNLTIEGQLSANPSGFVQPPVDETTFGITDTTIRPRTQASVVWSVTEEWTANLPYQAQDASPILQEIIDQPAWSTGNPVVLFLKDVSLDPDDEIYRRVYTFESGGSVDRHPTLIIEYAEMPPLP